VGEVPVDAAGERHGCGGKISPDQARALCGMSGRLGWQTGDRLPGLGRFRG
jgi:hypothetical protein